jgi:Cof subfamily protein (haloacid dehalogenase superfamily)
MVEQDNELIQEYANKRNIKYEVVENFDNIELKSINKILAIDNNPELIENLQKELSKKYSNELYIVRSTPRFCEISDIKATKGDAVRFLSKKWNIKKDEIMACGDQDNDIELLLSAGTKVAMGNASQGLKNIADYVTETVDNDGVVVAIRKFIGDKYEL